MSRADIAQTLENVNKLIDIGSYNLERSGVPGATSIKAKLKVDNLGGGAVHRTSVVQYRSINPLMQQAYRQQITNLEEANIYTEFLNELDATLASDADPQISRLVTAIDDFFAQSKALEATTDSAMRQNFISKAQKVGEIITAITSKVNSLRVEADRRLVESTITANGILKSIFDTNVQLLTSKNQIRLHDQRDELVREISKHFDVKVSFAKGGTAVIQSKLTGETLVDGSFYSQFSYTGADDENTILNNTGYPLVKLARHDKAGRSTPQGFFVDADNKNLAFTGGKWAGLIKLRDEVLFKIDQQIKSLGHHIAKEFNRIHNEGSPYPPKGYLKSSIEVSPGEYVDWQDEIEVYFVDKKGDNLLGGAGHLLPAKINMSDIARKKASGQATIADLVRELNEKLDLAPSRERVAMGNITDVNGIQLPGQYLLNNLQLRTINPHSTIDNSYGFQLDLQGSAYFGSEIQILGVQTSLPGGGGAQVVDPALLPPITRLEAGENKAILHDIKAFNVAPDRVLTVDIQIIGDNGVIERGQISFPCERIIGANFNKRIAYDNTADHANLGGDFNFAGPGLNSHPGVARAKIVDANDNEIDLASAEAGRLVIETNDQDYRLVIKGGDFGAKFGFNNFFDFDEITGKLSVNPEIAGDTNKLSIGTIANSAAAQNVVHVGDEKASATLEFTNVFAIIPGETITIEGQAINFVNALSVPANENEILLTDGIGGPNGVVEVINRHSYIGNLVTATRAGNVVTIQAKRPGGGGNDINIAYDFTTSGATASLDGALAVSTNMATLQGGTDTPKAVNLAEYVIKPGNQEILEKLSNLQTDLIEITGDSLPNSIMSISSLGTLVNGLVSEVVNTAKNNAKINAIVLERTDTQIKEMSGIHKEQQFIEIMDLSRLANSLAHLLSMIQNNIVKVEDIIFR